jgi:hypothetical protein
MDKKIELNAAQRLEASFRIEAMATLQGKRTGLGNILVWISKRYPQHACRVKVSNIRNTYSPDDNFTLDLEGVHRNGDVKISQSELSKVRDWIALNREVIQRFWDDDTFLDDDMRDELQKV